LAVIKNILITDVVLLLLSQHHMLPATKHHPSPGWLRISVCRWGLAWFCSDHSPPPLSSSCPNHRGCLEHTRSDPPALRQWNHTTHHTNLLWPREVSTLLVLPYNTKYNTRWGTWTPPGADQQASTKIWDIKQIGYSVVIVPYPIYAWATAQHEGGRVMRPSSILNLA
jgi:hypothetical protein